MALSGSVFAANYDLPDNIPQRKPGLWEMVQTGTVGPNKLRSIKRYCLDAKADRALYELELLETSLRSFIATSIAGPRGSPWKEMC